VPLLAVQPSKPTFPTPAKTQVVVHLAILHPVVATAQSSPPKPAASVSSSSYAPGLSVLPHPPYPQEARDLQQTGTVTMNVQFDGKGDVAHAEVAQSSGVPVLDSETRSFIRVYWHSPAYAGQLVSVPVRYTLQNL
jgi:TonB family protein